MGAKGGEPSNGKRVRFHGHPSTRTGDSEDDEQDLREDAVNKQRSKGLRLDGYDSDDTEASSDSEGGETPRKDTPGKDEDMFEEPPKAQETQQKKTLESQDIEGQEWNADDQQEYTDEGLKLEPFNMDREMEEGHFDTEGHYIKKKDEFESHDKWLAGLTKDDILKVHLMRKRESEQARGGPLGRIARTASKKSLTSLFEGEELKAQRALTKTRRVL
jgi:hypothetical protein